MLDINHLETLESIADRLQEQWETINMSPDVEAKTVQAYAQTCAAITQAYWQCQQAMRDDEPFIQIGTDILRKSDIIRVESKDSCYGNPKQLKVYTRDIVSAGEDYGSCTSYRSYEYDSPEAQMFLYWLKGKTEILKDPSKCVSCGETIEE